MSSKIAKISMVAVSAALAVSGMMGNSGSLIPMVAAVEFRGNEHSSSAATDARLLQSESNTEGPSGAATAGMAGGGACAGMGIMAMLGKMCNKDGDTVA